MKRTLIGFTVIALWFLVFGAIDYFLYHRKIETFNITSSIPTAPQIQRSPVKHARLHSGRPIIEGGVHNLAQLEMAVRNPDIAESFAGIDLSLMHPVVLDHNLVAWVDYLVPNVGIYWVMNPVLLKKGEIVWTDGTNVIRGLCGNRTAFAPGLKVAPELEEISSALETPVNSVYTVNQVYPPIMPITPAPPLRTPPIYTPFLPHHPVSGADNPMPSVAIGVGCFGLVWLTRKILRNKS